MNKKTDDRKPTKDTNILVISGRLTRDVKTHGKVAVFGIAVHTIEKVEGDPIEVPFFLEVTAFGRTGENCAEYLKKGREVLIQGSLTFDEYEAKDEHGDVLFYDDAKERPVIIRVPGILTSDVRFL